MSNKVLPVWYNNYKYLVDESIENFLLDYFKSEKKSGLELIKEATIYACNGGKRIRSILAIEFYLIFSGKDFNNLNKNSDIIKFCIALELLHAYSLVHDDLPCMDNDILRRGQETVWKKYGEDIAILVGDLLHSLSFEVLSEIKNIGNYSALVNNFSRAIGLGGMLGGQVLDLYYENNSDELNLDGLIETHNKKTGELIKVSIFGGILVAETEVKFVNDDVSNNIKKYLDFGKKIGLAFQIKDDLLDVEGTFEETGKSVGSGEEKGFVYFLGIEKTKNYLNDLIKDSIEIIKDLNSEKLDFIVTYIGNRKS